MTVCLVLLILALSTGGSNDWNIQFDIPIQLSGLDEFYPIEFDNKIYKDIEIEIDKASLNIVPVGDRIQLQLFGYTHAILYVLFYFFIFKNLSKLLKSIKNKNPFSRASYHQVRNIGLIILGLAAYSVIFWFVISIVGSSFIQELDLINVSSGVYVDFEWATLFFGLLVLVLAEVFKAGNELKELEEQTV
jgi:hypothetical protein